jgi:DNA-directed RNA polymerase subunit H (RpoH/RPB5)
MRANDQIVGNVYKNITEEFIKYRKLTVVDMLPYEVVSHELFTNGYTIINCLHSSENSDSESKQVKIVLYHFNTSEGLKAADVKKLVSKFNPSDEIILVTQNPVSTHVVNYIKTVGIVAYTYSNFIIVVPDHILVPKYRVLNTAESIELIENLYIKKSTLPKVKRSDATVIWSHAKPGDIIEYTRNDEVAGVSIYYRLVV